ncbi:MAG TPA: hypothetical protein VEC56_01850 [Candidatus Krumholzibacteria bacterium]|nr:hypothetical protein [Candidatus Krumholzibacteria bacterium]
MRHRSAKILTASAVVAALVGALVPAARAQDWFGVATWQVSFPIDDTQLFTDEVSFRGAGIDFRKTLTGGTVASITMAWNVFHERTGGVYELEAGAISGTQDRYINSFPIMVGVHQYFGNRRSTRAYVGLNAGGYLLIQTFRLGITEIEEDSWEWGASPEAGVVIPIQTGAWFVVNAHYHWSPTPESLAGNEVSLTYYQLNVGFMWEQ